MFKCKAYFWCQITLKNSVNYDNHKELTQFSCNALWVKNVEFENMNENTFLSCLEIRFRFHAIHCNKMYL